MVIDGIPAEHGLNATLEEPRWRFTLNEPQETV
jgi:hypothetical protein